MEVTKYEKNYELQAQFIIREAVLLGPPMCMAVFVMRDELITSSRKYINEILRLGK